MTSLLDKIKEEKRSVNETTRKELLTKVRLHVPLLKQEYDFEDIYIFGSILREHNFNQNSDVDFAVSGLAVENFFKLFKELETLCTRDIDLIDLDHSPDKKELLLRDGLRL